MVALIISVINMKGGVGKTTLTVNLASGLAKFHNKRVLVIDVDPQFNATQYSMTPKKYLEYVQNDKNCTIKDIFIERQDTAVGTVTEDTKKIKPIKADSSNCIVRIYSNTEGGILDLLPSRLELMQADNFERGSENKLKRFVNNLKNKYDYIFIDCPPTMSIFTLSAYLASDKYLIPIKPDYLSSVGISLLLKAIESYKDRYGDEKDPLAVIFTMVQKTNLMRDTMYKLRTSYFNKMNIYCFNETIPHSTKIAETAGDNKTVFDIKDRKYGRAMETLIQEFLTLVEKKK